MRRKIAQALAAWHCHAPLHSREDRRLRHLRHGELGFQRGGGGECGAHAGNDFVCHAGALQQAHLLKYRAVYGRIAALDARHELARLRRAYHQRANLIQRQRLAADYLSARLGGVAY